MRILFGLLVLSICPFAGAQQATDDSIATQAGAGKPTDVHGGSLDKILNSFLRAYAADKIEWRANVKVGDASEASTPPAGFEKGKSETGLWYYYQPKTCDVLTIDERREVMRDPRFARFLAQMRAISDGKIPLPSAAMVSAAKAPPQQEAPKVMGRAEIMAKLLAGRQPPPDPIVFDITAEELIMPGPIVISTHSTQAP